MIAPGARTYPVLPAARSDPREIVAYIVGTMAAAVRADMICACVYRPEQHFFEEIAHYDPLGESAFDRAPVLRLIESHLSEGTDPFFLRAADLEGSGYESALFFPLALPNQILGLVSLFSHEPDAFTLADVERLGVPLNIVRTVVENFYLYEILAHNLVMAHAIAYTAQAIAEDPSPQHLVDVLRDYLFDAHVTSCALMLYGPMSEDRPNGPFEYLEMKGSWSRQRGSGIALGTRIYLQDYPELLSRMEHGEAIVTPDLDDPSVHIDPFSRSLLRAEGVVSLVMLPIHASQRRLGVIMIGTDQPHLFSARELESYQTVCEFLAISTFAQILLQQHDLVQQGRAALLDAVTDGVMMVLPDTAGARVLTTNQRFSNLFGVPGAQAQGLMLADLLQQIRLPEAVRRELTDKLLAVHARDPLTQRGAFHMTHATGHPLDIEWYGAPVYQGERVMGRIYIFHDVTAEREALRLRSAFLSQVSHELRTPLTSIHGFAQLILTATGSDLPPLAREYAEIILSSTSHLRDMFTDMIEVTRADAGELRLEMRQTHLPDVIIEAVARLEVEYNRRGQTVIMDLDDTLPPVFVDTGRIIQVVTNLIANAIKYSPEGSHIRIATRLMRRPDELPASAPADVTLPGILVTVDDEGAGLTWEDTRQIFMPFFRTQSARAAKVEGTGLGLTIARSIIELQRGRIWAEATTRERPGGHFLFTLPTM